MQNKSPIYDVEHIYLFNKNTLRLIFEKNKFSNLKIFNVSNYYPFSYWITMLPIPKTIKLIILYFLTTMQFDFRFWLNAGNIGISGSKEN